MKPKIIVHLQVDDGEPFAKEVPFVLPIGSQIVPFESTDENWELNQDDITIDEHLFFAELNLLVLTTEWQRLIIDDLDDHSRAEYIRLLNSAGWSNQNPWE